MRSRCEVTDDRDSRGTHRAAPVEVHDGELTMPRGPGAGIADPQDVLTGAVAV